MTEGMTEAEMARALERLERRQNDYVVLAVYERDMHEIREDISDIKDSQKWATRLMVGQFVVLVIALLIYVIQNLPPPP